MIVIRILKTINAFLSHPLGRRDKMGTLLRMLRWQIGSRILNTPVVVPFVNSTRLLARTGMHSATGNIYVGLMEFEDMAFVLHFMKTGDMFYDVGANIGVYSILAASRGATVLAIEPIQSTYESLLDNIFLNRFSEKIDVRNCGVGKEFSEELFTITEDSQNHILGRDERNINAVTIVVDKLDQIAKGKSATMIKIDVEGFEWAVIQGAEEQLEKKEVQAVLIELSSLGNRYGFKKDDVHKRLLSYGFIPARYDPFIRKLIPLSSYQNSGNTLYIRNLKNLEKRLSESPSFSWQKFRI
jgi:FkbM family methyltransferase